MGCCGSKQYEHLMFDDPQPMRNPPGYYTRRKPRPNEVEELAEALSLETFQKNRAYLLRKVEDLELDNSKVVLLLRSLKLDNERIEFIKTYHANFKNVKRNDMMYTFRNQNKFAEVDRYLTLRP